jgi:hypothetical protein
MDAHTKHIHAMHALTVHAHVAHTHAVHAHIVHGPVMHVHAVHANAVHYVLYVRVNSKHAICRYRVKTGLSATC